MKSIFKLLLTAICFALLLTGCKKDSETSSYLRGKVDGVAFECTTDIRATDGRAGDNTIFFRGDWPSYSIQFYLDGQGSAITEGAYNFQTGKLYNALFYQNNNGYSAGYFCSLFTPCTYYGSGKVTILTINKNIIKGTFEFVTAVDGGTGLFKTVTEGDFSIKRD